MQDRFLVLKLNSHCSGQIVALDFRFSIFERRGHGMNICPHRLTGVILGEQAIAFRKEILKRAAANLREAASGPRPR